MKTWKISLEMSVSDCWIEDGFNLEEQERKYQIIDMFGAMLPYAYCNEVIIKNLEINEI